MFPTIDSLFGLGVRFRLGVAFISHGFLTLVLCFVSSAGAVVIAGPLGSINTTPPLPDPGFDRIGTIGSTSGVYLRNGWVLTANHVGMGTVVLGGMSYAPVPNSRIRLTNPEAGPPDLILFKLVEEPPLLDVVLASGPRSVGEQVFMVGNGRSRMQGVEWTGAAGTVFSGWAIGAPHVVRWGRNDIAAIDLFSLETNSFVTRFDELTGPEAFQSEAQGVSGDSGGAAFLWNGSTSELVGLIFARTTGNVEQIDQPLSFVLFENLTVIADLWVYRDQIEAIIDQPDCENGLDDDLDGLIDFPDDPGCVDAFDLNEVPEPDFSFGLLLAAGAFLAAARRWRVMSLEGVCSSSCSCRRCPDRAAKC